ncbi:MAG: PAS domain-containing protein [Acidimicrobiia bacterium]
MSTQQPLEMIVARQLAGQLTIPMVLLDARGEVLFLNEAALELLVGGQDVGDAPVWVSELFVGDDGRPSREPFRTVLQHGEPAHARLHLPATATSQAILVTAYPVRGTAGPLAGAMVVFWEENPPPAEASSFA